MLIPVYRESSSVRNYVNHSKPVVIAERGIIHFVK